MWLLYIIYLQVGFGAWMHLSDVMSVKDTNGKVTLFAFCVFLWPTVLAYAAFWHLDKDGPR